MNRTTASLLIEITILQKRNHQISKYMNELHRMEECLRHKIKAQPAYYKNYINKLRRKHASVKYSYKIANKSFISNCHTILELSQKIHADTYNTEIESAYERAYAYNHNLLKKLSNMLSL